MYDYFMKRLIYQKFILGTGDLDSALAEGLGGVILFTKDIKSESQLKTLIKYIKEKALVAPFISIDQEGGRVERTENIRPKRLSAKQAYEQGMDFLKEQSSEISQELAKWGFNLNFAPCIDVNTNPDNPIIGERSFSALPDKVVQAMRIFVKESRINNIIPCVKHFPGHGDADRDSHLTLPVIDLPFEKMKEIHIEPFKKAVEDEIEMIMVAHLHCTCFDKEPIPASLSKNVISYLRNDLGYKGVIITDDMVMKGVQNYGSLEACIMAIKAGVDMFIFRNSDESVLRLMDELAKKIESDKELQQLVIDSNKRIITLKEKVGLI